MTVFHAIVLGIVQGLGEFIPISSSGHLLLVPWLFGWEEHSLTFDVALHLGTTLALVAYFGRDWAHMIGSFLGGCRRKGDAVCEINSNPGVNASGYMVIPIVLACVPAAVVGIVFEDEIEKIFRTSDQMPLIVAAMLSIMAVVLYLAERVGRKKRTLEEMNAWDWITIGCAQALALIPGVSRSGATITMGLFRNLKRDSAAMFSFLLSAPIIFGASGVQLVKAAKRGIPQEEIFPFIVGVITATIVGYACLAFLMNYLKKHSTALFIWYRFALSGFVLILWIVRN